MFAPAVTVHGFDHACLALAAGRTAGRDVCLLSAPWAGRYAGVAWWRAMLAAARAATPCAPDGRDLLDCGAAPGAAMAALRHGQLGLILDRNCPAFAAIQAACASLGATLLDARPPALDLSEPGAARALAAWLARSGT